MAGRKKWCYVFKIHLSTSCLIVNPVKGDPTILMKGFSPKEDPKLSFEGNKVHTLLKLFQGESSKLFLLRACICLPRLRLGRASVQTKNGPAQSRQKQKEWGREGILERGSYNVPQYIATLLRPELVAKHSITHTHRLSVCVIVCERERRQERSVKWWHAF